MNTHLAGIIVAIVIAVLVGLVLVAYGVWSWERAGRPLPPTEDLDDEDWPY